MPVHINLVTPNSPERLGEVLLAEIASGRWSDLHAAVAYVKMSGVKQIATALFAFASSGTIRMTVGIDQQGSSLEGVQTLWQVLGGGPGALYVLSNPVTNPSPTFHPKVWLFSNATHALLIAGSGNLTGGGLFTNYEFGSATELDLADQKDRSAFDRTKALLDDWADTTRPEVTEVSVASLQAMHASGELPSERAITRAAAMARASRAAVAGIKRGATAVSGLFGQRKVPPAPPAPALPALPGPPVAPKKPVRVPGNSGGAASKTTQSDVPSVAPLYDVLYVEVNPRNKTELHVGMAPLKEDPAFFGWPFLGLNEPRTPGKPGDPQPDPLPTATVVVYEPGGAVAGNVRDDSLKLWVYQAKGEFRLTLIGGLLGKTPNGSIMVMRRQPPSGEDYAIEIYPPGHKDFARLKALCTKAFPSSSRRYGWQ